jgi:hypothetical protein
MAMNWKPMEKREEGLRWHGGTETATRTKQPQIGQWTAFRDRKTASVAANLIHVCVCAHARLYIYIYIYYTYILLRISWPVDQEIEKVTKEARIFFGNSLQLLSPCEGSGCHSVKIPVLCCVKLLFAPCT